MGCAYGGEIKESPLLYSELEKSLVSPTFDVCLPFTVVEWLQGKCLACDYGENFRAWG